MPLSGDLADTTGIRESLSTSLTIFLNMKVQVPTINNFELACEITVVDKIKEVV